MNQYPKPGEKYQHYKGGQYEVVGMCNHTNTNEILVIYKSLSFGGFHARPYDEWHDPQKIDNGRQRYTVSRFEKM